jgi:hypothetical protein
MSRFRRSFGSNRAAISAVALYALFLHGFFAAAAQAQALNFPLGSICSSVSGTPAPQNSHNGHGLCCILVCAACGCAYLASEGEDFASAERLVSAAIFLPESALSGLQPYKFYLGARGPPLGL